MGENKTAQQVRDEHLQKLGSALGPLYHALYDEVIWLHAKWQQYRILFAESQERIDLLNSTAGFFFYMVEKVLREDIVLHIARLTDRPQSVGRDNLTLLRLAPALEAYPIAPEIAKLIEQAHKDAGFARDWRNRLLAHTDLDLALNGRATPLSGISRENIEHALGSVRTVLNRVENYFWKSEVAFEYFIAPDDAKVLVHYLGVAVDVERR
jgi:hypothetical protein